MIAATVTQWGTAQWVGVGLTGGAVAFVFLVIGWEWAKRHPPFSWLRTLTRKRHPCRRKRRR